MTNTDAETQAMYMAFRKTIDEYFFPLIKRWAKEQGGYLVLKDEGEPVGFLIVVDGYVDGIYVKPEHRRKGIARKAVIDYINNGGVIERLHVVRSNKTALKFWKSIFVMTVVGSSPVDVLYGVQRVKT